MPIGLIADLAVGTDGGGSHAWSRQREILPDRHGRRAARRLLPARPGLGADRLLARWRCGPAASAPSSNWCAPPSAMPAACGSTMPWGCSGSGSCRAAPAPAEGAYLRYPVDDLLRLLALESHRHRAIVIGEDLGTLPEGFHDRMDKAGILGMRVLWFEQEQDGRFRAAAPLAAQRHGDDHDARPADGGRLVARPRHRAGAPSSPLPRCGDGGARGGPARARIAPALWTAFLESGAATGDQPGPRRPTRWWMPPSPMSAAPPAPWRSCRSRMRWPCRSSRTCPARSTSIRTGGAACRAMPPRCWMRPMARRLDRFARPAAAQETERSDALAPLLKPARRAG